MKSLSYQFICVVIRVIISSHYICLISATCAMPDPIPNTITTLPNQTLDTCSYITWECSDGYMMDGLTNTAVRVCLEDGSWLGHTPICTAIKCPSPPIAAYSELDPPLHEAPVVNHTISYACTSEYTLLGINLNRCLQDGTWENDPPVCERDCDDTSKYIKRYSNLTCYRGRGGNNNWIGSKNLCTEGELLATVKDAETQTFLVDFIDKQIDNSVWIGAMEGLDWIWRHSGDYIERFFWQNPFPSADSKDCIELSYQNGSFSWSPRSYQSDNGLLCQYDRSCQSVGLNQSDMVLEYMGTCFQFLDVSKNCNDGAAECGRGGFLAEILDESTNALLLARALYLRDKGVNTTWWIGGYDEDDGRSWYWSDKTRVIYESWRPGRPDSNHCVQMRKNSNYQWDDLSCTNKRQTLCQIGIPACGDPGEPLYGNRLPDNRTTYSVDATLHFTCQEGYILSGKSVLRCMNNGSWNHQRPSCKAVECEESPPDVTLATTIMQESVYQDIAVYTCQDGYIPDNEPISFCLHSGTWSSPNFTCTALSPCYSNPCAKGGTCTVSGSSFTCTCPSGYTGQTCEEEFSPCNSKPCMNGGTCLYVDESSFSCTCTPGYIGSTCNEEIMLTTPFPVTTQATLRSTESQTESQTGESSPTGAIAAGSSVAILFILAVIVLTVILSRRRRVQPDDENEMDNYATVASCYEDSKPADSTPQEPYYLTLEADSDLNGGLGTSVIKDSNYAAVANCYEDSKPADSTPQEPYYLTLKADSDQNGGFGTSVAEQPSPHLWKRVTQDDTPSVIKGSNGWNETDTGDGFVDNVLYGTSDEQSPKPGNPKSGAPETDDDAYEGYEDEEVMVDNELYNAPSRTTLSDHKLETVDEKGNDDVYENPDENVYTEFTDDEKLIKNELYGAPSPITPRAHKLGVLADEGKDPVYESPDGNVYDTYAEEADSMVDNELYGAATPPTSRADNTNDPVVGEEDDEMYQNIEFHSVPTNLIANELYKSVDEI